MKGNVFIGWCVDNSLAIAVSNRLSELGYKCTVGGNYSEYENTFIGETIIKQLKSCNQAIFLISTDSNGMISNNVTFEIGFSFSKYNTVTKKTHLFYLDINPKDKCIPSDLLGAWAHHLVFNGRNKEEVVDEIVSLFLNNQKNTIQENKMDLINSWFMLDDMLSKHFQEPQYSDYEMAQYLLFYAVSSGLLGIFAKMKDNLSLFKRNVTEDSYELYCALSLAETMYEVDQSKKRKDNLSYIDDYVYLNAVTKIDRLIKSMEQYEDSGFEKGREVEYEFKKWFLMIAYQRAGYISMTYANNPDIDEEDRKFAYQTAIEYQDKTIEFCNVLKTLDTAKNREMAMQYRAFCYRNNSIAYAYFGDLEKSRDYRLKSFEDHRFIHDYYKNFELDARLADVLEREYYLLMAETIGYVDNPMQKRIYLKEIEAYTNYMFTVRDSSNMYINRIKMILESKDVNGV